VTNGVLVGCHGTETVMCSKPFVLGVILAGHTLVFIGDLSAHHIYAEGASRSRSASRFANVSSLSLGIPCMERTLLDI
jgi:hypothetical protein